MGEGPPEFQQIGCAVHFNAEYGACTSITTTTALLQLQHYPLLL